MSAIIFAVVALVGWGTADVFGGSVARKIGGYSSATLSYFVSIFFASLYIPFALPQLANINLSSIIFLIFLVPIGIIPLVALYQAISIGNAPLNGTIAGSYSGLVVLLSLIFLGEKINIFQIISIVTILVGLVTTSLDLKNIKVKQLLSDKGIPYAILALVTWGIYFTFIKIPIQNIGWFWPAYISWWGAPLVLLFMKAKSIKFHLPHTPKPIVQIIIQGFISTIAFFSFSLALERGQSSIVSPIASSYPVLFAVIAYFVFKDRLTKQQIAGIIVTLVGVVSLSLIS